MNPIAVIVDNRDLVIRNAPLAVLTAVRAGKTATLPPLTLRQAPKMLALALGPMAGMGITTSADDTPQDAPEPPAANAENSPTVMRTGPDSLQIANLSIDALERITDGAPLRFNGGSDAPDTKIGRAVVMVADHMVIVDGLDEDTASAAVEGRPVCFTPESIASPR